RPYVQPLEQREAGHAWHLYVVKVAGDRASTFAKLRGAGIGVNVHYVPVHLHPFYRRRFATRPGLCPVAEAAYQRLLSLPMLPAMTSADVRRVVQALDDAAVGAAA